MNPARDFRSRKTEVTKALHDGRYIEGGMNRVTGTGVVQCKFEQCFGRQTGAGAAKPDPCRRQIPEIAERST